MKLLTWHRRIAQTSAAALALILVPCTLLAQGARDPKAVAVPAASAASPESAHGATEATGEAPKHDHAHAAAPGAAEAEDEPVFEAPPETADEDPSLPGGSIEVALVDAREQPLGELDVTLGIVENSIAKGENRKRENKRANAAGSVRWDNLTQGSSFAYRVTVVKDGATFALPPFQLPQGRGIKGKLHVYPVSRKLEELRIGSQGSLYCELKDDRLQIEQTITVFNVSPVAWVPDDVILGLPEGFMAFTSQQGMTDVGLDAVLGKGAKLRGTIGPGRHELSLRWQLPYSDETSLNFAVGMAPRTLRMQVATAAASGMQLDVKGFEEAKSRDSDGQRFLVTGRQIGANEAPIEVLRVALSQIPLTGLPPQTRTLLVGGTALAMLAAIAFAATRSRRKEGTREDELELKAQLLAELEELERAFRAGDVGPKTYERARRELIDDLARCLGEGTEGGSVAA